MKHALIAIAFVLLITGCSPVTLKTAILSPSQVTWSYQSQYSQNAWCDVPLPGQGLFLNGLGPEPANPGEAPSGYDDIFDQGAPPFACVEQEQILYRGQFQFDLSQFYSVAAATLNFNVSRSTQNAEPQQYPSCVATTLGMSTGTIDMGNGPFYWPYDNDVAITPEPNCLTLIPPTYSIGVSDQVRQWVSGSHTNNGFIIAGPILNFPSNLPQDNNGNVSWYNNFNLLIVYNPALNPRAPQ
jgi:hypothetical protein